MGGDSRISHGVVPSARVVSTLAIKVPCYLSFTFEIRTIEKQHPDFGLEWHRGEIVPISQIDQIFEGIANK
jgi:hypothetical protein